MMSHPCSNIQKLGKGLLLYPAPAQKSPLPPLIVPEKGRDGLHVLQSQGVCQHGVDTPRGTVQFGVGIVGADAERRLRKMTEPIHKGKDLPPVWVIHAASGGGSEAMEQVLRYYDDYMSRLCTRTLYDKDGTPHVCVDTHMKRCLEIRLIRAVMRA